MTKKKRIKKGCRKAIVVAILFLMGGSVFLNSGIVQSAKDRVYSELESQYITNDNVVEPQEVKIEETTNVAEVAAKQEDTAVVETKKEEVKQEEPKQEVKNEVKQEVKPEVKEEVKPVAKKEYSVGNARSTEERIWDRLRAEGYDEIEAAGIIGNIWAECDMDYTKIEKGSGVGKGLIQWSWSRRTTFEKVTGSNWKNLDVQLDFLINEMNGKYGNHWTAYYKEFKNTNSPEDAAYYYCEGYERPSAKRMSVRKSQARNAYNRCAGRPVVK